MQRVQFAPILAQNLICGYFRIKNNIVLTYEAFFDIIILKIA
jgi:hypothetical protein